MSHARLLIGDVFERMAELPDASVDLVLTSPPFLALRSYLPADHPMKSKEIGSEPTPAAFLDTLLALTAEWRRLLAPHGSICVELGDTYSGKSGADDGTVAHSGPWKTDRVVGQEESERRRAERSGYGPAASHSDTTWRGGQGWPLGKSLCGIPHLYHLSLAYGRNLLTGEPSPAGQWRVRNVVAWCRPNPPVGALGDKFRPGTSYMTVACVSGSRYFDLDAVRERPKTDLPPASGNNVKGSDDQSFRFAERINSNPAGAPPLDWWEIPTQPYAGAHYATFPSALCERPIKAMCPQRVCVECGEPSRRIVDTEYVKADGSILAEDDPWRSGRGGLVEGLSGGKTPASAVNTTTGWSDCGHGPDNWRNGLVLDPFAGSGTTLAVATGHGRDAVGIDLDSRNADLCAERVGMFLDVELPDTEGAA